MEVLYLLCSILSTCLTSLTLSFLLPFRRLLRRRHSDAEVDGAPPVSLYQGTVWHERRRPVHHSFRYSVRYALIDLDRASHAPPGHLSADQCRSVAQTNGPVFLLTIPPSVGYEQNPLSLYYCYEVEGSPENLKKCIAEVTNTPWGERVSFLFNPNTDLIAKPLHVSPFMDMLGNWRIKTKAPKDNLFVSISVQHPKLGDYFTATLTAKRILSLEADHALFFWLMPHKVAVWIYWHALKLWWKGVPFIQHPRYSNLAYRQETLIRDTQLQCCQAFAQDTQIHLPLEGRDSDYVNDENGRNRCFTWREAKWPWS
ncbi:uncharacterized protein LOC130753368 [Actinidia eriantha]|uniref:uncharacterized protein LOC130753368 n=1 Tax=Actinidia eriantha TaxID=165200 RepID=UPI0025900DD3|nr:uncharacterized protein LOC130753368 [Actinidia eriantha]